MHPRYSVIVPCYNEEAVLHETHRRLTETLSSMDGPYEILYVNDGSQDRTADILRYFAHQDEHVRVIMFARNAGHQMAVSAGLDYATGDAIIIIDADLQDPPELIPHMAEKWQEGAQVVYGQRNERAGESSFKKFTASAYYKLLSWMTGSLIPRDTGDFRLVDRKVADVIRGMPEHARFLRGMFAWAGFKQEAIHYDREPRFAGTTHYPLKKMLKLAGDGIFSFSVKPLKFITWAGLGLISISLFVFFLMLLCLIFGASGGLWWLSTLMTLFTGVLLTALGIVGEYIARIYDETRGRPLYIVSDTVGFGEED